MAARVRSIVADVGHHDRVDGDGDVERPPEVVQVVHRPDQEGRPSSAPFVAPEPLLRLGDHPRGEVERDDPPEAVDQVGQERAGPAAEVGHGLRARVGHGPDLVEQRVLDPGAERVEEQVVVPGRGAAPVAVLAVGVGHGWE